MAFVCALLHAGSVNAESDCEAIELASGTAAYAELLSAVDALILEKGFGCTVNRVNADAEDTLATWLKSETTAVISTTPVNKAGFPSGTVADAAWLQSVNDKPVTETGEGWWITPATIELHPEIKTVLDVLEHPELFATESDPARGAFYGCPLNSNCQPINANLFRAFQMQDKGWTLITPDSVAELESSIANAFEQGQNWFGYHWSPAAAIGRHNLIKLDFGIDFTGDKNWDGCITRSVADCEEPRPSAWRPLQLHTFVTETFVTTAPAGTLAYLSAREFPGNVMSKLLATQQDKALSINATAIMFLQQHDSIWRAWVPEQIANKVTDALSAPH